VRWTVKREVLVLVAVCAAPVVLTALLAAVESPSDMDDDGTSVICCGLPFWYSGMAIWAYRIARRWDDAQKLRARRQVEASGRCWGCGYDISRLSDRCPECGHLIPPPIGEPPRNPPGGARAGRSGG
jgi:hypothetical protein